MAKTESTSQMEKLGFKFKKEKKEKFTNMNFWLPEKLCKKLSDFADENETTEDEVIRQFIEWL